MRFLSSTLLTSPPGKDWVRDTPKDTPARWGGIFRILDMNFRECSKGEVRRIRIPRTRVNRGAMRKCLTLMNSAEQRSKPERERPEKVPRLRALSDSI